MNDATQPLPAKRGRPVGMTNSQPTRPQNESFMHIISLIPVGKSLVFPCQKGSVAQLMRSATTVSRYADSMKNHRYTTKSYTLIGNGKTDYSAQPAVMITRIA